MEQSADQLIVNYADAYERLYQRQPRELRRLEGDWVLVNGAQMRLSELVFLTEQIQLQLGEKTAERRSLVIRLLKWFTNASA